MDDWITIHMGPVWQVELYAGLFAENGIKTFLPDATTKVIDPFVTGAQPLSAQLQVRAKDAEHAQEVLDVIAQDNDEIDLDALALATKPDPSLGISEEEASGTDDEASLGLVRQRAQIAIETLATRTRWAAVSLLAFPLAVLYGLRYRRIVKRRGLRSVKHRLTMAALALGIFYGLVSLVVLILSAAAGGADEPQLYW